MEYDTDYVVKKYDEHSHFRTSSTVRSRSLSHSLSQAGLFSAVSSAFVIGVHSQLQPDSHARSTIHFPGLVLDNLATKSRCTEGGCSRTCSSHALVPRPTSDHVTYPAGFPVLRTSWVGFVLIFIILERELICMHSDLQKRRRCKRQDLASP